MPNENKRRAPAEFYRAFDSFAASARARALNQGFLTREAQDALRLTEELRGYEEFLAKARKQKAQHRGVSLAFEREVQSQARQARDHVRHICGTALRLTKHVKNTGILDEAFSACTAGVKSGGKVRPRDVWEDALAAKDSRDAIDRTGVSAPTLEAMAQAIDRLDPVLEVKHDKIRLKTAGQSGEVVISRRSARARAKTIDDLLFGSQFDAVAEVFHQPGRVLGDLTRSAGRTGTAGAVDPLDSVLAGASFAVQELHRHVRKLEDVGLAIYEGDEAAVAALILLIVVFAAMMIVGVAMMCGDDTICIIGGILLTIAIILFGGVMRDLHMPGDSHELALAADGTELSMSRTEVEGGMS